MMMVVPSKKQHCCCCRTLRQWQLVSFVLLLLSIPVLLFLANNTYTSTVHGVGELASINMNNPIFSLLVTLQFSHLQYKDQFLLDIAPVAEHCRRNEPDTLSYEVLLQEADPLQVLVVERYRDKDMAYLKVHKSSGPFLAFRPKLQAMQDQGQVKVSGHSYLDSGIGYFGQETTM